MTDLTPIRYADHLLPPNATPLERALSASDARLLEAPTGIIRTVLDPWRCPAHLLPYLAAHWGVDDWDPRWPETVKRQVIAAAPEVHRTRGTRYAVETALAAFNIRAVIREWFEVSPPAAPHTFSVIAYVTQRLYDDSALITADLGRAVLRGIIRAKRHSQWFSFAVGVGVARQAGLVARARVLGIGDPALAARPRTTLDRPAGLVARARALGAATASTVAQPMTTLGRRVAIVARARVLGCVTLNLEAQTL